MRKLIILKSGNAELCLVTWKDAYDIAVTKASWSCVLQYSGAHSHSYTRNVTGLPFPRVKKWKQWDDVGLPKLRTVNSSRKQTVWKDFCSGVMAYNSFIVLYWKPKMKTMPKK